MSNRRRPRTNAFVHLYRGELTLDHTVVRRQRMAILASTPGSDGVVLQPSAEGARAILFAGAALNEPIAQHGPFVMRAARTHPGDARLSGPHAGLKGQRAWRQSHRSCRTMPVTPAAEACRPVTSTL